MINGGNMELYQLKDVEIVNKIWGMEEILVSTPLYSFKHLILQEGFQSSLHEHHVKDETFIVLQGVIGLEYGNAPLMMTPYVIVPGVIIHIPPNTWHRFVGLEGEISEEDEGLKVAVIAEVASKDSPEDSYRMQYENSRVMTERDFEKWDEVDVLEAGVYGQKMDRPDKRGEAKIA